jgi:hypothetical protein
MCSEKNSRTLGILSDLAGNALSLFLPFLLLFFSCRSFIYTFAYNPKKIRCNQMLEGGLCRGVGRKIHEHWASDSIGFMLIGFVSMSFPPTFAFALGNILLLFMIVFLPFFFAFYE